jgi:hypothetical protein
VISFFIQKKNGMNCIVIILCWILDLIDIYVYVVLYVFQTLVRFCLLAVAWFVLFGVFREIKKIIK